MAADTAGWRLRPDCLVVWPVFLSSLVFTFFTHFGDLANNDYTHLPLRALLLVGVQVVLFAFLGVVRLAVRTWQPRHAVAALVVAVVVGATARGLLLGWLLYQSRLAPASSIAYRTGASLVLQTLALMLLWLATSEVVRHHERQRILWLERDRLLLLQQESLASLQQLDEEAAEGVRRAILASLDAGEGAEAEEVLGHLRQTADGVVRPLSRRLESEEPRWRQPEATARDFRLNWWNALRGAADPRRIHPLLLVGLFAWGSPPLNLLQYGPRFEALFIVALFVVELPVLWWTRAWGVRATEGRGSVARASAFFLCLFLSGAALGAATLLFSSSIPHPGQFLVIAPTFAVVVGGLVAFADSARSQTLAVERDLEEASATLRWRIARAREEDRQRRGALAHAVHGRIQAALAAAILQLDGAVKSGTVTPELVEEVQTRVVDCVMELDLRHTSPDPLPELVRKVRQTWEGLVKVSLECGDGVDSALDRDEQCLTCLNDLVPELVFNAMKHGHARSVELRVSLVDGTALELLAIDDGAALGAGEGMGSRLLDDCSIEWNRSRRDRMTVIRVLLPLLPHASSVEAGSAA